MCMWEGLGVSGEGGGGRGVDKGIRLKLIIKQAVKHNPLGS